MEGVAKQSCHTGMVKIQFTKAFIIACLIMAAVGTAAYYVSSAYILKQAEKNITNLLLSHKGIHHYVQNNLIPAYVNYHLNPAISFCS